MSTTSVKAVIAAIILLVILFFLANSVFIVREGQVALLLRLGEIETNAQGAALILNPGLHFKWPFINTVKKVDVRLQNLEAESPRILTKEQKYLYVDYYAKWAIANVALYYTRTGGLPNRAESLLTQKINDSIRAEFGKRTLQEVIADDRLKVMASLLASANKGAMPLGLKVIDVRIKSIDLLKQVRKSVFQRMSTRREQAATEYRADGQAESEKIRSQAEATARKLLADAERKAALTRASGDATAAEIYINAYAQDLGFYSFYRSLEAYRQVFLNKNTIMVLKPDSEFLKFFNQPKRLELRSGNGNKAE